jgi:hypothetical protein
MTRALYAIPAAFCLAAAVVTAQTPAGDKPADTRPATQQPAGQQPAKPSQSSTMAGDKVTYTGCVKPGTTAGTWTLENAQAAAKAGASSPSTVGTSGTGTTLNLDPAATVNLKAHANHKVEIVGTLAPAKSGTDAAGSSAGASATAGASSSTAGAAGSSAARQQFSVESLKMVSATCP